MSETLHIPNTKNKAEIYAALLPQLSALVGNGNTLVADLANISAALYTAFKHHWIGFYLATAPQTLTLGPFQGPIACTVIPFSRGVCGAAAREQRTQLVPDVEKFPGHIACSSLSKSEIVVPLVAHGQTQLVLDIDSDQLNDFDTTDQNYLEQLVNLIKQHHFSGTAQRQVA